MRPTTQIYGNQSSGVLVIVGLLSQISRKDQQC